MKLRSIGFRNVLLGLGVSAAMLFGAAQAIATDSASAGTRYETCSSFSCKKECGEFGGDLGPGGPGKPLVCYCCG